MRLGPDEGLFSTSCSLARRPWGRRTGPVIGLGGMHAKAFTGDGSVVALPEGQALRR